MLPLIPKAAANNSGNTPSWDFTFARTVLVGPVLKNSPTIPANTQSQAHGNGVTGTR